MGRRAETPHTEAGREIWKALQAIEHRGHNRERIFRDWLDIMLNAYLSLTAHVHSGRADLKKPETWINPDNRYEAAYKETISRYADDQPTGKRCIDHFAAAYGHLLLGIYRDDADPLGDVYMSAISFGEHGQFFTPAPVATMMAEMTLGEIADGQTVCDPTCGSGVMLIAAAKKNPKAILMGIDLDERCAKMTALNICLRELTGRVYCGDALTGEMRTAWTIQRGWITQNDSPDPIEPRRSEPEKPAQLTLL